MEVYDVQQSLSKLQLSLSKRSCQNPICEIWCFENKLGFCQGFHDLSIDEPRKFAQGFGG